MNIKKISDIIEQLDKAPLLVLVFVNICISLFVLIAHGGYLLVSQYQATAAVKGFDEIYITIPLAAIVLLSCILALIWRQSRHVILSGHGVILTLGAIVMFGWALSLVFGKFPEGNFSWSPGFLTFLCVYPLYLLRRTLLKSKIETSHAVKYGHVYILIVVLIVDLIVMEGDMGSNLNIQHICRASPFLRNGESVVSQMKKLLKSILGSKNRELNISFKKIGTDLLTLTLLGLKSMYI